MGIFFTQIVDPNVIPVDDYFRVGKNEVGVDALLDAAAQGSVDYHLVIICLSCKFYDLVICN
jgi:hypothetical protein